MKNIDLRIIHETHKAQVRACLKAVSDHPVAIISTVSSFMVCCILLSIPQVAVVIRFFVPLAASTALCAAATLCLNLLESKGWRKFRWGDGVQRFRDGNALKDDEYEANSVDRLAERAWDSQFGQYTAWIYRGDAGGEVGVGKAL